MKARLGKAEEEGRKAEEDRDNAVAERNVEKRRRVETEEELEQARQEIASLQKSLDEFR